MKNFKYILAILCFYVWTAVSFAGPTGQDLGDNWCSDV